MGAKKVSIHSTQPCTEEVHLGVLVDVPLTNTPQELDMSRRWLQDGIKISTAKHWVFENPLLFSSITGVKLFRLDNFKVVLYLFNDKTSQLMASGEAAPYMMPDWKDGGVRFVVYLLDSTKTVIEKLDTGRLMNTCLHHNMTRDVWLPRPEKYHDVAYLNVRLEGGLFNAC